jgi:Uma2 family endonuclease
MSAELLLTKQGPWTLEDLAGLPEDGRRYEIVDGSLLVSPPPGNHHQVLAFALATLLHNSRPAGYRVLTPGTVELGPNHYRAPDVLLVAEASVRAARPLAAGPADVLLAVEVMSPGSVTEDRVTKPAVYARAGIPHYWRLESDVDGRLTLYVYRLVGEIFREGGVYRGDADVVIDEPLHVRFDLSQLLD